MLTEVTGSCRERELLLLRLRASGCKDSPAPLDFLALPDSLSWGNWFSGATWPWSPSWPPRRPGLGPSLRSSAEEPGARAPATPEGSWLQLVTTANPRHSVQLAKILAIFAMWHLRVTGFRPPASWRSAQPPSHRHKGCCRTPSRRNAPDRKGADGPPRRCNARTYRPAGRRRPRYPRDAPSPLASPAGACGRSGPPPARLPSPSG